jgi:predicted ATP-dependent endonuclease of OLD family
LNYLVKLLTRVLNEYKIEAQQSRLEMAKIEINPTFNNSNENYNSQNTSIEITLDQTMQEITKCHELSPEDKITLQQMLFEIETAKKGRNKSAVWEKIKTAGKWILEKGIEVGTAALPYIAQALK